MFGQGGARALNNSWNANPFACCIPSARAEQAAALAAVCGKKNVHRTPKTLDNKMWGPPSLVYSSVHAPARSVETAQKCPATCVDITVYVSPKSRGKDEG